MVTHSLLIPYSTVIKSVEEAKKVMIVGCAVCANNSIAYEKDQPVYEFIKDGENETPVPFSMMKEIDTYRGLLEEKGVQVDSEIIEALCYVSSDEGLLEKFGYPSYGSKEFVERSLESDAVIVLGCNSALQGMIERLGDVVKVVPAMKAVGISQYRFNLDDSGRYVMTDKERSSILKTVRG